MTQSKTDHYDMAAQFYKDHELDFTRAATEADIEDRRFDYSSERFDTWAVQHDLMPARVIDTNDPLVSDGLLMQRHKLRRWINSAGRTDGRLQRMFSIEARNQHWRVLLLERLVAGRPGEAVRAVRTHVSHLDSEMVRAEAYLATLHGDARITDVQRGDLQQKITFMRMHLLSFRSMAELMFKAMQSPDAFDIAAEGRAITQLFAGQRPRVRRKVGKSK